MRIIRYRKWPLIVAIAATAIFPLLMVSFEEPTLRLNVYKLLAKAGSLCGTMLIVWQFLLGFRGIIGRFQQDLLWVYSVHKALGKYILLLIVLHPVFITFYYIEKYAINPLALRGEAFNAWVGVGMAALVTCIDLTIRSKYENLRWILAA